MGGQCGINKVPVRRDAALTHKGTVKDMSREIDEITREAWEGYGCSQDTLAQLAGEPIERLVKGRDGSEPDELPKARAEEALAVLKDLKNEEDQVSEWLNTMIIDGVPVRRKALTHGTMLKLARGEITAEKAMSEMNPKWRSTWRGQIRQWKKLHEA